MTTKFSSKEIHFLKTDSDESNIKAPESYFSDMIQEETLQLKAFEKRLVETSIPGEKFLCAAIHISSAMSEVILEKAKDTFEATFNSLLDNKRGIWESLDETSFILAFWDYDNEKKASQLILSIKKRISEALKAKILIGVATFPFHDFSKAQTIGNALKAIDHAAFFGPDTLIEFDATSINICGDRLYQLNKAKPAIEEYKKGLDIAPTDINLMNSLAVCYGVMGELEDAKLQFEKAMKINPSEIMVIYNLGLLHKIDDNIDKAIIYLRKAHGADDSIFEVELLLGHLLFKNGRSDQALPHLERAARIKPESSIAFRMQGEIYLENERPEKAASAFNKAIKINPSDATSLSGYAKSLELQEKNLTIALTFAKQSIALDPSNKTFKARLRIIQEKIDNTPVQEKTIKSE
jgi:tetratricopeptide (TPR) repeat protein